jgi:hypothetical protein
VYLSQQRVIAHVLLETVVVIEELGREQLIDVHSRWWYAEKMMIGKFGCNVGEEAAFGAGCRLLVQFNVLRILG